MSIIGRKAKSATSGVVCEILGLVDSGVVVLADGRIVRKSWGDLILLPGSANEPDFSARPPEVDAPPLTYHKDSGRPIRPNMPKPPSPPLTRTIRHNGII